jgi:hypothetical protein
MRLQFEDELAIRYPIQEVVHAGRGASPEAISAAPPVER